MTKYQWISLLGLWVMVFLFLGFPSGWDEAIAVVTGLVIIAIAYRGGVATRAKQVSASSASTVTSTPSTSLTAQPAATFVENKEII